MTVMRCPACQRPGLPPAPMCVTTPAAHLSRLGGICRTGLEMLDEYRERVWNDDILWTEIDNAPDPDFVKTCNEIIEQHYPVLAAIEVDSKVDTTVKHDSIVAMLQNTCGCLECTHLRKPRAK